MVLQVIAKVLRYWSLAVFFVDGVALIDVNSGEALGALWDVSGGALFLVANVVGGVVLGVTLLVLQR